MHTVILGNGILAATIAFRLTKRLAAKDRITIIGKRSRPGSATLAAAAMLNSFAEIEVGSLNSELDRYRFELSRAAGRMWPQFEKEIGGPPSGGGLELGTYVVNNTAADDLDDENFDAIVAALREFGEPFEPVAPRDIPNYMPEQRHRATRALVIPGEGWMNPRLVLERLDAILARHPQVSLVDDSARSLVRQGDRISAVKTEGGQPIAGDSFVLATGATASDVLRESDLGIEVQRVFYGVGVSVEIGSPDFPHKKCIRTPNRGLACGIYSVPYFTGSGAAQDHVLVGASNFISPTPYNYGRLTSIESLMRGAIEQINANFYRADLVRINVGWRPTTLDTYPLLGRSSIANLIIASGTKRDGFHLAPLISEKIVAMLYDEPVDEGFARFAPERKPIRSLTRQEAIDKAVRHQMSASYQHGFTPSKSRMPAQIAQMHRDDLERLHDKVGAHDWGIPPEMLDMYRYGHAMA
ncbi:MAG: FAD-dependent oxidoreductase [Betaproteobacteria bacterium]|nr:MAG: FAD-dependent oxidoreductase [Betaproteobacteria bacterium]